MFVLQKSQWEENHLENINRENSTHYDKSESVEEVFDDHLNCVDSEVC